VVAIATGSGYFQAWRITKKVSSVVVSMVTVTAMP